MDHQQSQARGRSPSAPGHQLSHINYDNSPSPAQQFGDNAASNIGLGLGIDAAAHQQQHYSSSQSDFPAFSNPNAFLNPQSGLSQDLAFDSGQTFTDQLKTDSQQFNQAFLTPQPGFDEDFTIFPSSTGEQLSTLNTPLFSDGSEMNIMQAPHSPTPPNLLSPDPHQPGSAHQSPSFNAQQFSSPAGRHSRNVSLGPEAALLPGQDWSASQYQGHRRSASEFSDVSSIGGHSPLMVGQDSFPDHIEHSPLQRPQDTGVYQELHGIGSFSISDHPNHGRSPSHSPAISPRILPQSMPDLGQTNNMALQNPGYAHSPYLQPHEAFPQLQQQQQQQQQQQALDMSQPLAQMSAPTINVIPAVGTARSGFEGKSVMDTDALTPPEGRGRARRRAHTDPYNTTVAAAGRDPSGSLSPNMGSGSSGSSRSLSPLDRSGTSPSRRRGSTSSVPNNVMALRLADPEFAAAGAADGSAGGKQRVQKHPATFQCTLCPKRFTRAYNLRSHLRTHTDERPFVCTVCNKAFARQHDRKRHEGLHSGEKKFVCKGDLKAGGNWGCGRRFARADALGRHFRSEAGRICIKPLLDEEMLERQRMWQEQHMQQQHAHQQQSMMMGVDPATGFPLDASGGFALPAALLAQYPALAQVNWSAPEMAVTGAGSGMEDEMSGRSSYDASDYDDADDGGYVSGPGTGFGPGGMGEGFGEVGYASDYGGR